MMFVQPWVAWLSSGFHCYPGMHKYLKEWMAEFDVKIDDSALKRFYSRYLVHLRLCASDPHGDIIND
jgi:hypothetical protein